MDVREFEIIKSDLLMEMDGTENQLFQRKVSISTSNTKGSSKLKDTNNTLPLENKEHNLTEKEEAYKKYRQLLNYEDAPKHLQFNPFIRKGYRNMLPSKMCLQSVFWFTNETVNIWSHVFGLFLFLALFINDVAFLKSHATFVDKIIIGVLLISFCICMCFSSLYHIFSCRSETDYDCFLSYDLFGIAISLLAIYISGIYYFFYCDSVSFPFLLDLKLLQLTYVSLFLLFCLFKVLRNVYIGAVVVIFCISMIIQIPKFNIKDNVKIAVFVSWAAFGIIPIMHWYLKVSENETSLISIFIPKVVTMYVLVSVAFLIYITRIPERWFVGKTWVNYFLHSHNWWHLFVLAALFYWHNSGMKCLEYRLLHGCSAS
ncbi:unnamed protein product [Diamesa serratosioi]